MGLPSSSASHPRLCGNSIVLFDEDPADADCKKGVSSVASSSTRPRALTTVQSPVQGSESKAAALRPKHGRATSALPGLLSRDTTLHSSEPIMADVRRVPQENENLTRHHSSSLDFPSTKLGTQHSPTTHQTPKGTRDGDCKSPQGESYRAGMESHTIEEVLERQTEPEQAEGHPTLPRITNPFLDVESDHLEKIFVDDECARPEVPGMCKDHGLSFDELVDRLLWHPMSKSDGKFAAIFLCLYRKFAAPSELVTAIIHRFQIVIEDSGPQISRITTQLRYLAILAQWVSDYPGDFAHPQTRHTVTTFISGLSGIRTFAVACKEIGSCLDVVSEDDDTDWACSDTSRSRANTAESFLSMSSVQSTASTLNADSSTEDVSATTSHDSGPRQQQAMSSVTPSLSSSVGKSETQSTGSFQTLLNSVEHAQRQAQLLTPIPRNLLTKVQWHQLMDTNDEEAARELTRIDWIMFSSIRPRDLVRHVSLSGQEKEKCKSLEHVNRMIEQFNHVAFWVANLVLLRDKPKHRAKMLEKFMSIGWVGQAMGSSIGCALT